MDKNAILDVGFLELAEKAKKLQEKKAKLQEHAQEFWKKYQAELEKIEAEADKLVGEFESNRKPQVIDARDIIPPDVNFASESKSD